MAQVLFLRFSRPAFTLDLQFIVVSSAILGIGLGSLIVYFLVNNRNGQLLAKHFTLASFFYSVLSLLPFLILHFTNFYPRFLVAVPFFISELAVYTLGGFLVALTFRYYSGTKTIYLVYFVNLAGSGLGAFAAIFLLDSIGINAIVVNFVLALIVSAIYAVYYRFFRAACIVIAVALSSVIFSGQIVPRLRVICEPQRELVSSLVNSFSQVDLYINDRKHNPEGEQSNPSAGFNRSGFEIYFECSNTLSLPDYSNLDQVKDYPNNFPYLVKKYDKAVILGSGGGLEVAEAVLNGVREITAVEINPLVIKTDYIATPNNIYENPAVKLIVQEGRNYMLKTKDKFDLVYIPSSKNFGNIGLVSYALQANYLYSKESFRTYLDHLTDRGVLAVLDLNPIVPQYTATIKAVLLDSGRNPEDLILVQGKQRSILLYKNHGFDREEMANINKRAGLLGSEIVTKLSIVTNTPVITLDRPFLEFRHLDPAGLVSQTRAQALRRDLIYILAVLLISYFLFLSVSYLKNLQLKRTGTLLLLFTLTGFGFIAAELYLIEKLSVILGHPTVAMAVGSAALLIFGGAGSLVAGKIKLPREKILIPLIIAVSLIFYRLATGDIIEISSFWEFNGRFLLSLILAGYPGFLTGFFFAKILSWAESLSPKFLPWAIGLDALASFIGGILFEVLALSFGFGTALIVGIVSYALCAVLFLRRQS